MNTDIGDNDGDSFDWDGDGYVNGQELKYGTDIYDEFSHPGILDASIEPEPASMYINEDDYSGIQMLSIQTGFDDDGDYFK